MYVKVTVDRQNTLLRKLKPQFNGTCKQTKMKK